MGYGLRKCPRCGLIYPLAFFSKRVNKKGELIPDECCKACRAEIIRNKTDKAYQDKLKEKLRKQKESPTKQQEREEAERRLQGLICGGFRKR